jgi:HEAT repeat protein
VGAIAGLLDHPVVDVRADAARALRVCGSENALPALRERLSIEESSLVRHELIESIQALAR